MTAASGTGKPAAVIGVIEASAKEGIAVHETKGAAYITETVLGFDEQLEHIGEFVVVLLHGVLLSASGFSREGFLLALVLLLQVRPIAVTLSLLGAKVTRLQRALILWCGIRSIGSLYYLMFASRYVAMAPVRKDSLR